MNQTHTIRFGGNHNVRLLEVDGGWQLQRRNDRLSPWYDLDGAIYRDKEEAIAEAQSFCTS